MYVSWRLFLRLRQSQLQSVHNGLWFHYSLTRLRCRCWAGNRKDSNAGIFSVEQQSIYFAFFAVRKVAFLDSADLVLAPFLNVVQVNVGECPIAERKLLVTSENAKMQSLDTPDLGDPFEGFFILVLPYPTGAVSSHFWVGYKV